MRPFAIQMFLGAIAGVVFTLMNHFGLRIDEQQVHTIVAFLLAWIAGDSVRSTRNERRPTEPSNVGVLMGLTATLAAVSSTGLASAQTISTPKSVDAYRLVRTVAESADGDDPDRSCAWIIRRLPDAMRPEIVRMNEGRVAIWTGPPGRYEIDLICQSGNKLSQALVSVKINAPEPLPPGPIPPEPGPNPPGPSPDDVPEDRFGNLGRALFQLLCKVDDQDFPAKSLADLYCMTGKRLTGDETPIIPTFDTALVVLEEGRDRILLGSHESTWAQYQGLITATWQRHQDGLDRSSAAQFFCTIATGFTAFDNARTKR